MEIFRVFGTMALREEGNIEDRINQTTQSAGGLDVAFGAVSKTLGIAGAAIGILAGIITTALLVPLGKSIKFADEFTDALGLLNASTGTTGGATKKLGEALKNVYKAGYGDDIRDVADAMEKVKQQTGLSGKALEDQTQKIITLSKAMDTDYGETIKTVDNLTKNLNITSEEAFELIVQGWENGLNANGDYLDVLNEYAVQIKQAGLTADEFFSILQAGHKNGVFSLDKLIDAQKEFNIRSVNDSKLTKEAYKELGISYKTYSKLIMEGGEKGKEAQHKIIKALMAEDDKVKQNQLGVALFGTMWEDLGPKGISSLLGIDNGMDKTKSHMDELNKTNFDSISEAFKAIGRSIEVNFLLPVGNKIVPVVLKAVKKITQGLDILKGVFDSLADRIKKPFGESDKVIDKVHKPIKKIKTTLDIVKGDFKTASEVLKEQFDIVAKTIKKLRDNLDKFREIFKTIFSDKIDIKTLEEIKKFLDDTFGEETADKIIYIVQQLSHFYIILKALKEKLKGIWESDDVQKYVEIIKSKLPDIIRSIGGLVNAFIGLYESLLKFSKTPFFADLVTSIKALIGISIPGLLGGLQLFFEAGRIFYETLSNMVDAIGLLGNAFVVTKNTVAKVSTGLSKIIVNLVDGIIGFFKGLFDKLVGHSIIPDLVNGIITWFAKLPGRVAGFIRTLVSNGINSFANLKNNVINSIKKLVSSVINSFRDLISRGRSKFDEFKRTIENRVKRINLYTIGKNIVQGLINGLGSLLQQVKNKASEIAKAVEKALKDKLKLKSPSKVMYDIGVNIVEGLNLGLKNSDGISKIKAASDIIYNTLTPETNSISNVNTNTNTIKQGNINVYMTIDPKNITDLSKFLDIIQTLNGVKKYKTMMGGG